MDNVISGAGQSPEYGIVVAQDVMMPMRDGLRLATDIYRPALNGEPVSGPLPTILGRTSYDKTDPVAWIDHVANFFTPRGYAVVLQDIRGRHRSDGTGEYMHSSNPKEGEDGYDTVEWIASQPWSNGRVGTVGTSHGGIVQTAMALYRPPHLTAMWADMSPITTYNYAREGGAMTLFMFGALLLHAHDAQELRANPAGHRAIIEAMENLREVILKMPFKPGHTPLAAVPNLENMLFDYYCRGEYDDFWSQEAHDFGRILDRHADIPLTISSGWFDAILNECHNYYTAISNQNSACTRLVIGPWSHYTMRGQGGRGTSVTGDADFGPAGKWGDRVYNAERLRWFDRWLKDIPTGVDDEPPVRIFVMGGGDGGRTSNGHLNHGGRWRYEREWPLSRARATAYYLRSGGGMSRELPGEEDAPAGFAFDPDHPVPTVAGNVAGYYELIPPGDLDPSYVRPRARMRNIVQIGAVHQKEEPGIVGARPPYPLLSERPDVLVFQTPPLEQAVEVTGPVRVRLWVSSTAVDTDFTAKLLDVHPPSEEYPAGYHMNLTDSIIRARYRESREREVLMDPGHVYEVLIDLFPTSNLFEAGHRIRVDVSSSNFPRFDVNPNTGEPMGRHTHTVIAHNRVYLDRDRPSHIVLPVVP